MPGRLKDKVCIITGTGSGMGRAAALLFCAEGAKVVGCDINAENTEATLRKARQAGGQMVSLQPADLTQQDQCDALVELALKSYGGIDVVYNNAATAYFGWMDQFTFEEFACTIDGELLIVFRFCKTVWPHLVARGGGSIINVASTSAKVAYKALPGIAHTAAKGGVLVLDVVTDRMELVMPPKIELTQVFGTALYSAKLMLSGRADDVWGTPKPTTSSETSVAFRARRSSYDHQAVVPPSTAMSAPVTNELSSEARNSAAGATSSGLPTRPNISFSIMGPRNSGSLRSSRVAPVSMRPGEIVLARMLCLPPSTASCRVMARTPPLAAVCAMPGSAL